VLVQGLQSPAVCAREALVVGQVSAHLAVRDEGQGILVLAARDRGQGLPQPVDDLDRLAPLVAPSM
jgi:hypothetical protein